MKKTLSIVLILSLFFICLVGCKSNETKTKEPTKVETPSEVTPTEVVSTPTNPKVTEPVKTPTPVETPTVVTPTIEELDLLELVNETLNEYKESSSGKIEIELNNGDESRKVLIVYNYNSSKQLESLAYEITGANVTHIYLKNKVIYTLKEDVTSQEAFNSSTNKLLEDSINEFFTLVNSLLSKDELYNEGKMLVNEKVTYELNDDKLVMLNLLFSDTVKAKISFLGLSKQSIDYPSDLSSYGE